MDNQKLVLNVKEVCALLGIGRTAFYKLRKLGVFKPLPHLRRCEKYPFYQVLDYVNQTPKSQEK
jgi:hypothetical protein